MAICNNKKCSLGECDQSETCLAYVPVMTNADRIRAMSDEELADLLDDFSACNRCRRRGNDCFPVPNTLEWLQQPVEDAEKALKEVQNE